MEFLVRYEEFGRVVILVEAQRRRDAETPRVQAQSLDEVFFSRRDPEARRLVGCWFSRKGAETQRCWRGVREFTQRRRDAKCWRRVREFTQRSRDAEVLVQRLDEFEIVLSKTPWV